MPMRRRVALVLPTGVDKSPNQKPVREAGPAQAPSNGMPWAVDIGTGGERRLVYRHSFVSFLLVDLRGSDGEAGGWRAVRRRWRRLAVDSDVTMDMRAW